MKKSLITLAVLSFAGAASAQSSVTLYGVADLFFGQTNKGAPGKQLKQTVVDTDGLSSSRWGFKGSEDLGGGLRELEITKLPFLDEWLCPTKAARRSVAVGSPGRLFRCHKPSPLSRTPRRAS